MGARVWTPQNYQALQEALREARKARGVRVIVVPVSLEDRVPGFEGWWDVPVAEVSSQPEVQKARQTYEAHLKKQRHF
jgi:3D-(3,5/4)-trihydroxycyclohexane-1,2-dione acylhydrolase (decyclizing)